MCEIIWQDRKPELILIPAAVCVFGRLTDRPQYCKCLVFLLFPVSGESVQYNSTNRVMIHTHTHTHHTTDPRLKVKPKPPAASTTKHSTTSAQTTSLALSLSFSLCGLRLAVTLSTQQWAVKLTAALSLERVQTLAGDEEKFLHTRARLDYHSLPFNGTSGDKKHTRRLLRSFMFPF